MVEPASRLADLARDAGSRLVMVNLQPEPGYDQVFLGRAEEVLPRIIGR